MNWVQLTQEGSMLGSCEERYVYSGCIKTGDFLVQLSDYYLIDKSSVPWNFYKELSRRNNQANTKCVSMLTFVHK